MIRDDRRARDRGTPDRRRNTYRPMTALGFLVRIGAGLIALVLVWSPLV